MKVRWWNRVQPFGHIAKVFTDHPPRSALDAKPFERGVISMHLVYDGKTPPGGEYFAG